MARFVIQGKLFLSTRWFLLFGFFEHLTIKLADYHTPRLLADLVQTSLPSAFYLASRPTRSPIHPTVVVISVPRVLSRLVRVVPHRHAVPGIRIRRLVLARAVAQAAIAAAAAHAGLLGRIASAQVARRGVLRQRIGILARICGGALAAETKPAELFPAAVAFGVVVGRGRAEAPLLAAVADEREADEGGKGEEEAAEEPAVSPSARGERGGGKAYMATMDTARHAVSILHACLRLGSAVNPPLPLSTTLVSASPLPKGVSTIPLQDEAPLRLAQAT